MDVPEWQEVVYQIFSKSGKQCSLTWNFISTNTEKGCKSTFKASIHIGQDTKFLCEGLKTQILSVASSTFHQCEKKKAYLLVAGVIVDFAKKDMFGSQKSLHIMVLGNSNTHTHAHTKAWHYHSQNVTTSSDLYWHHSCLLHCLIHSLFHSVFRNFPPHCHLDLV